MYFKEKIIQIAKKTISLITFTPQRDVIKIYDQLRFGNHLYFFLNCFIKKQNKRSRQLILYSKEMEYWLDYFPKLKEFVVYSNDLKYIDKISWFDSYYQNFGIDFNKEELNLFIHNYITSSQYFLNNFKPENNLIINIRRGDYYSKEEHSGFRFDQIQYIKDVFNDNPDLYDLNVEFVSDDVQWCLDNLKEVTRNQVIINNKDHSSINDFIKICNATKLIITNSTFSYWGGYIAKYLDKENLVTAPDFGGTSYKNNIAIQLHPDWQIINIIKNA